MLKSAPLAFAAALLLGQAANAAISTTATTDLNLRSGPGIGYDFIGVIPSNPDAALTVMGCTDDSLWCMVSLDGQAGWAAKAYVTNTDGAPVVSGDAAAPNGSTVTFASTAPLQINAPTDASEFDC